ncbi:GNAT family N-acetyltransferase [Psychrobacillus psychrodurans]|uniref:GNAT family N-acetyltransferase n=1 Tax=Psychrobacillus psychrodurans TaxID=126157 RepID=A0A9X3LBI9_9BACI|nr:GNAT family N-acetyltransferase [Psychrobacillus psychrodurans]MCZ8534883.1 GNAT family N-acetyltransferase [Psychrobacillus psychrodurans]
MSQISMVENLFKGSFKVLDGMPQYIGIEERERAVFDHNNWKEKINTLNEFAIQNKLSRISALINRTSEHYLPLSQTLINLGFEKYASKVEVFSDLNDINNNKKGYDWQSLSDYNISEDEFKKIWEKCMYASENSPTSLTMDEHLNSVKNEIGENWSKSCNVIYLEDNLVGISIPHIERGTVDEGRIFYFGILPEERGKGHSISIHYQSMNLLKEMGATYYIGITHETNKKMQKVFLKNGCLIKAETESYYKYISN